MMFVTTRDTGGRRRSKGYASNTTAKSSKTSLSSVFTVGSAGSGDSSSTVTQSSYDRSQHKRRKRPKEHRHRTDESHKENKNKSIDVFAFLVEKDASEESLPLIGQARVGFMKNIVGNAVEHESGNLEDAEELEDLEDPEESEEFSEPEEPDGSEDADEAEQSEELEGIEGLEDPEGLDELEECEDCMKPELDEDLDKSAKAVEPDDIPERPEPPTNEGGDSEDDEDDEDNNTGHQGDDEDNGDESDAEPYTPDIVVHKEDSDPEVYYRSMSDSGISMGSCSMDASISSLPPRLAVLREEIPSRPSSQLRSRNELAVVDPRWTWNTSPGPFHEGFIPPPAPVPPPIMYEMPVYPPYPPYTPYGTPPPMPDDEIRGPAIKIREPSHLETKPKCFRSFTKMSTRLILQLQDDIAELEGELSVLDAELDAIEADSSSDDERPPRPGTAKHMLRARECEIYQELRCKLDEYSSSLESMQKIENMSQPAVLSDLTKHHRWLESRISPSFRARHLVGSDLRTLTTMIKPVEPVAPPSQDTQFMAYSALINTLLPLVAFKLVSSVLSRLILLIIIVIVGVTVQDRTKTNIRAEDMNCILICVGISVFAAFFL